MFIIGTRFFNQTKIVTIMKNYDQSVEINHNPNWLYIPDHAYRISIIGGSRSGKANVLLNLIKYKRTDIEKNYLYVKDSIEPKYQLLINGRERVGIKKLKNPKGFIDYSQTIDHVYENLEDYNPTNKKRVLIMFDDMTVDIKLKLLNFYKRKKTQNFARFYIKILFQSV